MEETFASLLPVPAALVAYRAGDGRERVVPATWTAIVGSSLTVSLMGEGPPPGVPFSVHLPARLRAGAAPDDCPVRFECREGGRHAVAGRPLLRGEVESLSLEKECHRRPTAAELLRLRPFARALRPPPGRVVAPA